MASPGRTPVFLRDNSDQADGIYVWMRDYLCFGSFRFEPSTARLWQDEDEIKLTRKAAAVLRLLLDRAGQPVTQEDLFAPVWKTSVVSDDALVTCIQELRKVLSDDAKHPL